MTNWINSKLMQLNAWAIEQQAARDEGQGTVEYAVVLGVIVVAIVGFFVLADVETVIGDAIGNIQSLVDGTPSTTT